MNLEHSLTNIGLTETASRLYLRLLEVERASARQLAEFLGIPRPSVYNHLQTLLERGLITEMGEDHKKIFHVSDSEHLLGYVQESIDALSKERDTIRELLPKFISEADGSAPRIRSYAGTEGIRRLLNEMLWHEGIETYTMWPTNDMAELLGSEYLEEFNRKRIRKNVSIKSVWPKSESVSQKKYPFLGVGEGHLRERRIAPKGIAWSMSYWLFADKVIFMSSRKEGFGFVVQSHDFASLIKANFDIVWSVSKRVTADSQYSDSFLKTLKP